jgi:hypothetical protein
VKLFLAARYRYFLGAEDDGGGAQRVDADAVVARR